MKRELPWWKDWVTWILQSLAWIVGIAVAVKQLIPKGSTGKSIFLPAPEPDISVVVITAASVLLVSAGIQWLRDRF